MKNSAIIQKIRHDGPISVETFMDLCAIEYQHKSDSIGRQGDFITAPEMTQVFGEIIAMWLVWVWQESGQPAPFHLVELGPGRGTLMADILRCVPDGFRQGMQLRLVEKSPAMIQRQKAVLGQYQPRWHESFAGIENTHPLFVIANEFFDALAIRQFVRVDKQWRERMVGWDDQQNHLCFVIGNPMQHNPPLSTQPAPTQRAEKDGDILETSPQRHHCADRIASALARQGGAALIMDYGYWDSPRRDTLDAILAHQRVSILENPGQADISSDVDFRSLAKACAHLPITVCPAIPMGEFLLSLGLRERTRHLAESASVNHARHLHSATARLSSPSRMGSRFKAMAFSSSQLQSVPGWHVQGGFAPL